MSWAHNGQALVSADKGGMIKYFTPHLTNVNGFQGHREACHGVSWSPNDERFVTGGDDGLVKIWDYRRAKEERQLSGMSILLYDLLPSLEQRNLRTCCCRSLCGLGDLERTETA